LRSIEVQQLLQAIASKLACREIPYQTTLTSDWMS
jgi:hypothetical protein